MMVVSNTFSKYLIGVIKYQSWMIFANITDRQIRQYVQEIQLPKSVYANPLLLKGVKILAYLIQPFVLLRIRIKKNDFI